MFRIKPVKNHTIAKYLYQNSSVQTKENANAQAKLTPIIRPMNQIINNGKINPPLKKFVRPQNVNNDKDSKLNNPRLTKPHEKIFLKSNLNNNQHKLQIPIANQRPLKQKISQHNSRKDTLKKQQISISENPENNIVGKNQLEDKNIDKVHDLQKPQQFQVKKQKQTMQENLTSIIDQKQKNKQIPHEKQQTYESVKINNQPQASPIFPDPEQKILLKNEQLAEPQELNERQLEMQNLMIKIQKRRQARQQQKRRIREMEEKRKQDEQRALEFMNQHNQNGQLNQEGVSGILRLNDQLMHFSLAESVMDLQIKKLLKTNFNDFPNSSQIKYQIQELERINMSYEMVRMDENNPLRNGLRNYLVEIFNRIGQEIMRAQAQGYSNPNFNIMEHDGRMNQPQGSPIPQALRGLPKENQRDFIEYVENIGEEDCTICLGGLKYRQKVARLECGHSFHQKCIEEWIESSANCPTCRFNLKFGVKKI